MAVLKASENKTLNLSLSEDQLQIVAAERRVSAARRRAGATEREIERVKEDAALFGKPADVAVLRDLEFQHADDLALVEHSERQLTDAKAAPALRAEREKEGLRFRTR